MYSKKNHHLRSALRSGNLERIQQAIEPQVFFNIFVHKRLPDGSIEVRDITGKLRDTVAASSRIPSIEIDEDDAKV
jgi:hypothetical protein